MPPSERIDRLEPSSGLPEKVRNAVQNLDRFGHLEIGELRRDSPKENSSIKVAEPEPLTPASPSLSPKAPGANANRPLGRILCHHCSQVNESGREICWACHKSLSGDAAPKPAEGQEIQLVLDGATYKSSDPDVPHDVRMLMDRIREEGYSDELLTQWRQWRSTRNTSQALDRPFPRSSPPAPALHDAKAIQGQRVSVIRIDGKIYQSDDPGLTPEIREIFAYIESHGVTPELMEQLRQHGEKVRFRPETTANPSDGDVDFWRAVGGRAWENVNTPILRRPGIGLPRQPLTFHQQLAVTAISVVIPGLLVAYIWWKYFRVVNSAVGF